MKICDMHVHTDNSPDCVCSIERTVEKAISMGVSVLAIADHCNMTTFVEHNIEKRIANSVKESRAMAKKYADKIKILSAVEMGDYIYEKECGDKILKSHDFDAIVASVHIAQKDRKAYSQIDFGKISNDEIKEFLDGYFEDLKETAETTDFDILAHLTCPYRYINGIYSQNFDSKEYEEEITDILKTLIKREKAMEVNTSGVAPYGMLFPDEWIVKKYYDLGGRIITLGSDAHVAENVAADFDAVVSFLKECGFSGYYYYKKRNKVYVEF